MAKAVAVISGSFPDAPGFARVSYSVSVDNGANFGADAQVEFAKSIVQLTNDIKDKVVDNVMTETGLTIARADVLLFGGPS